MEPQNGEAIHSERFLRIACIGAGASGLCLAYKLKRSFQNFNLVVHMLHGILESTGLTGYY